MARNKKIPRGRFLVAFDSEGMHIRKTICVTHHEEEYEVQYDAKPVFSSKNKAIRKKIISLLQQLTTQ